MSQFNQLAPGVKVGLSTHAPAQADRAIAAGAEYIAIGETVMRFSTSISRSFNGANIGGAVLFERPSVARFQNQRSTVSSHSRSRSRRFS